MKQFFLDLIEVTRLKIQLASLPHAVLGALLAVNNFNELLHFPFLIYIILTYTLISLACHINCLYDVNVDLKYKKYMGEAVRRLGENFMKKLILFDCFIAFILILTLLFYGKIITSFLAIFGGILGWIYSAPPVRAKARGTWGFLPVFIGLYSLPLFGGWFLFRTQFNLEFLLFVIFYALMNEGITFVNTAEDYREDMEEGIRTIAHFLGIKNLLLLSSFLVIFGSAGTAILLWKKFQWFGNLFSFLFSLLTIISGIFISFKIFSSSFNKDIEKAAKSIAPSMGKWFMIVRYPLTFSAIAGIF